MNDATYDRKIIDKYPITKVVFIISEFQNDNAPIGWSKYIPLATEICKQLKIKSK